MFPHEGLDGEREGGGEEKDLAFTRQVVDHTVQHTLEILNKKRFSRFDLQLSWTGTSLCSDQIKPALVDSRRYRAGW